MLSFNTFAEITWEMIEARIAVCKAKKVYITKEQAVKLIDQIDFDRR